MMAHKGINDIYDLLTKEEKLKQNRRDGHIVRLVDEVLCKAIEVDASDIHFQPESEGLRVRYRVDGILYDQQLIDPKVASQLISRLKVLSALDIAEKRIPQDGKCSIMYSPYSHRKKLDLRVSTFPSTTGEKLVVRILDKSSGLLKLDNLGISSIILSKINEIISAPYGFFLVTGPTGSGKTTTLYAILSHLNKEEKNIITMEDPVEYDLAGITQSQVNEKAGFTFDKGLRSLLRQDPDIIMIGEIRDKITMSTAIESALTGHIVLSTLHTNDAPGGITRLIDMGVEPFLINASVTGILAQRLARKLCEHCKQEVSLTPDELQVSEQLGISNKKLYKAVGCQKCFNLGYKGRIGIFELAHVNDNIRNHILQKSSTSSIREE